MVDDEVSKLPNSNQSNINEMVNTFTTILTQTAEKTIGSHTNHISKPKVPWWNDTIKEAIKNKKEALNRFKKNKTQEHFIILKKLRAKSKFLIKNSKKESWKKFTSTINNNTHLSLIWNKIRSLKGLNRDQEIHITDESGTTSDPEEVAQKIGSYFQDNFSDKIYNQQFINEIKTKAENIPITFDINPLCPVQISQ